jgi:hypothetical protein
VLLTLEDALNDGDLKYMAELRVKAVKKYVEIEDYNLKRVVKLLSPSAGLHDRFSCGGKLSINQMYAGAKYIKLIEKTMNSAEPPSGAQGHPWLLEWINKNISAYRSHSTVKRLKSVGIKGTSKYTDNDNRVYYRDGINGRPDYILQNASGDVVGVVEVKQLPPKYEQKTLNQRHKQAAFYQIIFDCIEAYTIYHPKTSRGDGYVVMEVTKDNIAHAKENLEIIKHNFKMMLDATQLNLA